VFTLAESPERRLWVAVISGRSPQYYPNGRFRDAFQPFIVGFSEITILNVCSHREQSFRRQNQHDGEGREAANGGHSTQKFDGVICTRGREFFWLVACDWL
jgi:hypothetical protein